jgi:predicted PurR-regulated permease PerM
MQSAIFDNRFVFLFSVFGVLFLFFYLFSDICFPFIAGFVLAYLSAPAVTSLSGSLSRTFVSFLFALSIVLIFIIAGAEFLPRLKESLILLSQKMPEYFSNFSKFLEDTFGSKGHGLGFIKFDDLKFEAAQYLDKKMYLCASIAEGIAARRDTIWGFFSSLVIMPLSFFYFLKDWEHMTGYAYECFPIGQRKILATVSAIIRKTLKNFFHGQFYVVTTLSAYYSIALSVTGIDDCIVLGIISGMFSFIPLLGAIFSCFMVLLISVPMLTLIKLYVIVGIYFVGQCLEGYILYPRFVGKKTGLHPLWILFSFLAGAQLKGTVGVLIAIPLAAVIRNLAVFAVNKFKATQAYKR